jgi:hypothetical protein
MFDNMDEGTKGLVRTAYVNVIGMVLSSVGDPMILFVFVLYAMNVGMFLLICYYLLGDSLESVLRFFKRET